MLNGGDKLQPVPVLVGGHDAPFAVQPVLGKVLLRRAKLMKIRRHRFVSQDLYHILRGFRKQSTRPEICRKVQMQPLVVGTAVRPVFVPVSGQIREQFEAQAGAPHRKVHSLGVQFHCDVVNVATRFGVPVGLVEPGGATREQRAVQLGQEGLVVVAGFVDPDNF